MDDLYFFLMWTTYCYLEVHAYAKIIHGVTILSSLAQKKLGCEILLYLLVGSLEVVNFFLASIAASI